MASLRKKIGSPYYFACFQLPGGKRTQRSTKTVDRKLAIKLANQWEEAARRRLTETQARKVLSDIHQEVYGEGLESPLLSDYVDQWISRKAAETKAVTVLTYRHAVEAFRDFLGDNAEQPIHYVTTSQIAAWRDNSAKRASARTANNKLKVLRVLFQSAWRDGLISDNPAAKVSALKAAESNRRAFTLPELKVVMSLASSEWKGLILIGLYTGQRLKDVASLTWANVDMQRGEIRLSTSKTGRRQIIPIAKPVRSYLSELSAGDDPTAPLFPTAFPLAQRATGTGMLSQQFYELLVGAGLVKARGPKRESANKGRDSRRERNSLSFHCLRHTATSLLKNAGVAEAVARDIIGHDSAEISRHYTHVDEETKRRGIDLMPDITIKAKG
jgi:integrase